MTRFNPLIFDPLPYPAGEPISAETLEENTRRLGQIFNELGKGLESLAYLLGGQLLDDIPVRVSASADPDEDIVIEHELGRIPRLIAMSVDNDGLGGMVMGRPQGLLGLQGGNELPWTDTEIRFRASRAAIYQIIII